MVKFFRNEVFIKNLIKEVELFNYQLEDINWALKRSKFFNASDPGVGKTLISIAVATQLKYKNKIDSIFVIVKNNLSYHWKYELSKYSILFKEEDIIIVDNKNKKNFFNFNTPYIVICPNHLLFNVIYDLKKWNKKSIMLIVDECHEFKNSSAKRTQSLLKIRNQFEYVSMLSATPAINGFEDWYNQMKIIDDDIIGMKEKDFKIDISLSIGNKFDKWAITKYNDKKILEYLDKFKPYVIKRLKSDLPEMKVQQIIKPIFIEFSGNHSILYRMIRKYYFDRLSIDENNIEDIKEIKNKYPYLIMCIDNPLLLKGKIIDQDIFKPIETILEKWNFQNHGKILYLDYLLKESIEYKNQKSIIFDNHPLTLNSLNERYSKYFPSIIHGELKLNLEQKQKIIDDFNDKNKNKLLLLNPQIGGTGLNLNKACNHIIFFSQPIDTTLYRQAIDRTHRISSKTDSIVNILVFAKTLDQKLMDINLKRVNFNDNSFKF